MSDNEPMMLDDIIRNLSGELYHYFGNIGEAATPSVSGSHVEMAKIAIKYLLSLPVNQRMMTMGMRKGGWVNDAGDAESDRYTGIEFYVPVEIGPDDDNQIDLGP